MLKHNLLLTFRNFKRFKSTFIINLLGLSSGLACVILISLWVNDELNFDKFHANDHNLYQVMEHQQKENTINTSGQTPDFLAAALAEEIPEITSSIVVTPPNFFPSFTLWSAEVHVKGVGKFADKNFFSIFSYDLISGNTEQVLSDKGNMVVSESMAKSLFGSIENSIGKSVEWQIMDLKKQVFVTGVFKDVPANSSEQFDFVLTFDSFRDIMGLNNAPINWDNSAPFLTYVVTKENAEIKKLNSKLAGFLKGKSKNNDHRTLFLKHYSDNYLHGIYENGEQSGGRIEYVNLFSIIALFVLLIACINFMNLSTAQALRRLKEVGIKKAIGAQRKTLIYQYLSEALTMTILSVFIALVIAQLLLPQFSQITGKALTLFPDSRLVVAFVVLTFITALLAGSYPAIYLSAFNPAKVLKGQFSTSLGELWARKGLVVFQFALSVIFIVSVWVVYKQIEYVQTKNLGYNKDNIIWFETEGKVMQDTEAFLAEVKQLPGVAGASSMLGNIIAQEGGGGMPGQIQYEGKTVTMNSSLINYEMIELLSIEMKEGRSFSKDLESDKNKVIFNEAAVEALGIKDPVGKTVGGQEVLGVVKDFHFQSFHKEVEPYSFRLDSKAASTIMVKIDAGMEKQMVAELQALYKSFNPGFTFNYRFLDQEFQKQYVAEQRVAFLSQYFAGLAIIISGLGLFALASFTTEKRGKEIGIRKVLGSSELNIVLLLSHDFTKMILAAIVIAMPLSYYITNYWLSEFTYRIELKWWYFAGAGLITLAVAWLTIGTQTIKAARMNPVSRLRSE